MFLENFNISQNEASFLKRFQRLIDPGPTKAAVGCRLQAATFQSHARRSHAQEHRRSLACNPFQINVHASMIGVARLPLGHSPVVHGLDYACNPLVCSQANKCNGRARDRRNCHLCISLLIAKAVFSVEAGHSEPLRLPD